MTARRPQPLPSAAFESGLDLQKIGLDLLLQEIRALQAMIPAIVQDLPTEAETEEGFDNMPV